MNPTRFRILNLPRRVVRLRLQVTRALIKGSLSLRLAEPGVGAVDGIVRMNVYLGHSIESFVETPNGEVLIQIDDPASKKIYPEGSKISIEFNEERIRLLKNEMT